MRHRIFKLIDVLAHKPGLLLAGVDKHPHRQGVIVLERIEIDFVRVPERRAENHQLGEIFGMYDPDIGADQSAHAAAPDAGIDPVGFGPVMGIHIGFQGLDDKIGIVLPLPFAKFPMVVGAVFLDPFFAAMVDPDHDQLASPGGGHIHQVAVDRPAAEWGPIIEQVLGVLEVQNRIFFVRIVVIVRQKGPNAPVFTQLGDLKPMVDEFDDRVMRQCLGQLRKRPHQMGFVLKWQNRPAK